MDETAHGYDTPPEGGDSSGEEPHITDEKIAAFLTPEKLKEKFDTVWENQDPETAKELKKLKEGDPQEYQEYLDIRNASYEEYRYAYHENMADRDPENALETLRPPEPDSLEP